jgi:hypothetical protein
MKLKTLKLKKIPAIIFSYWLKYYKLFFILLFLITLGFSLFFWYDTFYRFGWSDEKKQQYTVTQNRNINLKEKEFNQMLEVIEKRKQSYNAPPDKIKDIFKSE